ncbi:hypothetical protein [Pendulispora albinea]|uniref:PEGA domain-containing protein n=1 Tax=Pendulispora albinea TaxID=2741071 RepID=A0ABZ2LX52_9BACT
MRLVEVRLLATIIVGIVSFFCVATTPREARAQTTRPTGTAGAASGPTLHVLSLETEDADEQAEALSVALRSRAREKLSWPIADGSPSLSMFLAALRCPPRPDGPCLQKIGDQLKTDRFIYGHIAKAGRGQLSAEVHLYVRGKPDASVKEVFSDNLKDQNDDYLRRMAARIIDRLTGNAPQTAMITVHAGEGRDEIWIDDAPKGRLTKGRALLELPAGRHIIEVRSSDNETVLTRREITVTPGADGVLNLPLGSSSEADLRGEAGGSRTRSIVGWGLIGLGAVAGGFGIYEGIHFFKLKSDTDDFRKSHQGENGMPSREAICQAGRGEPASWNTSGADAARTICDNYDAAKTASLLGLISGGVALASLGVGTYLLLTDTSAKKEIRDERSWKGRTTTGSSVRVMPYVGPHASGFDVHVVF